VFPNTHRLITNFCKGSQLTNKSSYVKVGDSAPNFCLPSVNGEDVQLSDYSGNQIAMFFWASW